jgi:hypothetical protein
MPLARRLIETGNPKNKLDVSMKLFGMIFQILFFIACFTGFCVRFSKTMSSNIESDLAVPLALEQNTGKFKLYLLLSAIIGALIFANGFVNVLHFDVVNILFVLLLQAWNLVSVAVTFIAPARWSFFPILFVASNAVAQVIGWATIYNSSLAELKPGIWCILIGGIIEIGALRALQLISAEQKKRGQPPDDR